jgi:hypothetical protein
LLVPPILFFFPSFFRSLSLSLFSLSYYLSRYLFLPALFVLTSSLTYLSFFPCYLLSCIIFLYVFLSYFLSFLLFLSFVPSVHLLKIFYFFCERIFS